MFPLDTTNWASEEVAVGKWVDGKTIYRKRFTGNHGTGTVHIDSRTNLGYIDAYGYVTEGAYWINAARMVQSYNGGMYISVQTSGTYDFFAFYFKS